VHEREAGSLLLTQKPMFLGRRIDKESLDQVTNDPLSDGKRRAIGSFVKENLSTFANLATFGPHRIIRIRGPTRYENLAIKRCDLV
jgi:hypothetical protein